MYVCVCACIRECPRTVLGPLQLELQVIVSPRGLVWATALQLSERRASLLTIESTLHPKTRFLHEASSWHLQRSSLDDRVATVMRGEARR